MHPEATLGISGEMRYLERYIKNMSPKNPKKFIRIHCDSDAKTIS